MSGMRIFHFLLVFLFVQILSIPISDAQTKVDVEHYTIRLDITNFNKRFISGNCELILNCVEEHSEFELDLLGLTVDSVLISEEKLEFEQEGERLKITWKDPFLPLTDSRRITVYYGGKPQRDRSWGGFMFSGEYAYNLGVGFDADPHNFGRVWYPCKDNFTDRATYDYYIITPSDKVARCNGALIDTIHQDDKIEFHWRMSEPIPTYLSSVGVAPYVISKSMHRDIPIELASERKDSLNMANSFENLDHAIDAFVDGYGPHTFSKIGYHVVPFNGGAMEHATNIAYPHFACDGSKNYETLFAHELAHHWWGNTVTCRTQEDMWINEGWASYSENLFTEETYGREAYANAVSSNHKNVLHYAHLRDGDTLPVSGIGHQHTYGSHVYDKGGDMVHTLRSYMGDESFFQACKSFMSTYKFKDVSSMELRDHFQRFTKADLNSFFYYWIFNPGFPHFDILEWEAQPSGEAVKTKVRIRQRLKFAPEIYQNVPLVISVMDKDGMRFDSTLIISSADEWFTIQTGFEPVYLGIDLEQGISDAITDQYQQISDTGTHDFGDALMTLRVKDVAQKAFVRVTHNWISPDRFFMTEELPFLSKERYWTVDGIWDEGFRSDATIEYNGQRTGSNYALGYLDVGLISIHEDSLKLYYRPHATAYWKEYDSYELETGSKFNRKGLIHIRDLKKGEYALAMNNEQLLSSPEISQDAAKKHSLKLYPNPAKNHMAIECSHAKGGMLEVTDQMGKVIFCKSIRKNEAKIRVITNQWAQGIYYAGITMNGRSYDGKRFVVRH